MSLIDRAVKVPGFGLEVGGRNDRSEVPMARYSQEAANHGETVAEMAGQQCSSS